jgi:hypothetical protein
MHWLFHYALHSNAINNGIASRNANSPIHVKVNDLATSIDNDRVNRIVKVYPL